MPISSSILTIFLAASRKYKSLGRLARCMIELEIAALPWINLTAGASREERRGGEASSSHGRDGEGKLFARDGDKLCRGGWGVMRPGRPVGGV